MRLNLLAASLAVACLAPAGLAHAGEGMWVPQQLPEIAGPLKKAGLKLSPEQLSNLTGDWISPEQARDPDYWVRHLRETVRFEAPIPEFTLSVPRVLH